MGHRGEEPTSAVHAARVGAAVRSFRWRASERSPAVFVRSTPCHLRTWAVARAPPRRDPWHQTAHRHESEGHAAASRRAAGIRGGRDGATRCTEDADTFERHDPRSSLGALAALAVVLLVAALLTTSPSPGGAGIPEVVHPGWPRWSADAVAPTSSAHRSRRGWFRERTGSLGSLKGSGAGPIARE